MINWKSAAAIMAALLAFARPFNKEQTMAEVKILNARQWGDQQSRSYLPVAGSLGDRIIWKKPTSLVEEPVPAVHLSIVDTYLAVWYGTHIVLLQRKSGEMIWTQEYLMNCSFETTADGFVNINPAGYLRMLGFDQELGPRQSLPLLDDTGHLFLLRRLKDEFLYSYQLPPDPSTDPGDDIFGPQFEFVSLSRHSNEITWIVQREGIMLTALFSPDGRRACMAGTDRLFLIDLPAFREPEEGEEREIPVREVVFHEVLACSYDHQGNLLIIDLVPEADERPEHMLLLRLGPGQEQHWALSLGKPAELSQPPASFPNGDVCLTVGREIWRIRDGERKWVFPLLVEPGKQLITLLEDGSVLAAAGHMLLQISEDGEELNNVALDEPITCRPVMSSGGRVYVAGVRSIRCIK